MTAPLDNMRLTLAGCLLICWFYPFLGKQPSLWAQEPVDIFGYFESTLLGSEVRGQFSQLTTNKLRVDLKYDLAETLSFAANVNYISYHGKTRWNVLDYLAGDITAPIPENRRSFYNTAFQDKSSLDNAYLKLAFEKFDITAGKQQISLGSGYVWNPTDIFNIKDPFDPTYEQPGHNALRLDFPLGTRHTVALLYSPEADWKKSGKLLRFKTRVSHFDVALVAIESNWVFHDYTRFDAAQMNFVELPQRRRLMGVSTAGELLGVGVWTEYAFSDMESFNNFHELVAGADYTFDSQTYVMFEFYRNTLGKTDSRQYDLNDWMRQFTAEQKALSQDQLYAMMQHPLTDFLTLGCSFIYSISDHSLAVVPLLNYSLSENVDIMAYLNANTGKEGTAYATKSGSGGLLRARIYF